MVSFFLLLLERGGKEQFCFCPTRKKKETKKKQKQKPAAVALSSKAMITLAGLKISAVQTFLKREENRETSVSDHTLGVPGKDSSFTSVKNFGSFQDSQINRANTFFYFCAQKLFSSQMYREEDNSSSPIFDFCKC